ncbi:hypothetical protein UFOVP1290_606 [uncultured Caudovirales phage]|uniref:Uncharacterized protein n=1 Tax=uncultured Caudovirales phage TaxID=2100421 RepID=A0A6J5RSA3_9CAUD|nr:hypothetical protein UFOVP1290_606 [uncultured Caudovirales phage]
MSQSKKAYFQGTEEPSPKKKKYKSDPAIVVQPRFEEPFSINNGTYYYVKKINIAIFY